LFLELLRSAGMECSLRSSGYNFVFHNALKIEIFEFLCGDILLKGWVVYLVGIFYCHHRDAVRISAQKIGVNTLPVGVSSPRRSSQKKIRLID
jgi:hypothetical protein